VQCPSRSGKRRYRRGPKGSLWRPPVGGGLPISTVGQDPAERRVTTRVYSSCRAVTAPSPCRITCGLHPEGGAHAFIDGVIDQELKQHLLMSGDRSLKEAFNQTLMLEAAIAAAGPPVRLREVTRSPVGTRSQPAERRMDVRPVCWECANADHLSRDRPRRLSITKSGENTVQHEEQPARRGSSRRQHPHLVFSHFCLMRTNDWWLE
jgi:hypothetical protein